LIELYWGIGSILSRKIAAAEWGDAVAFAPSFPDRKAHVQLTLLPPFALAQVRSRPGNSGLDEKTTSRAQSLTPSLQQHLSEGDKGNSGFSGPDTSILQFLVEANGCIVLKLPGLNRKVGLGGMQFLRSGSKSLSLQDCEQISEMAKLGPIVHSSLLSIERAFERDLWSRTLLIPTPILWKSWQEECG
jgi:hypothetical protein